MQMRNANNYFFIRKSKLKRKKIKGKLYQGKLYFEIHISKYARL